MRASYAWPLMAVMLGGAAALEASSWLPFVSDDALISLRYAQRASEGLGLTWTDGERTEGYTDLLWVLLSVPAFWLHLEPLSWVRGLGLAGMGLALASIAAPPQGWTPSWGRALAALMVATSVPVAVWAIGGLEQTFLGGVLALGLVLMLRLQGRSPEGAAPHPERVADWLRVGLPFAAVVLTRADGVVLVAAAGLALLLTSLPSLAPPQSLGLAGLGRRAAFLCGPAIAWLAQTLGRRAYYGEWVPNTALAKVSLGLGRARLGLSWVADGYWASRVLVGAAVLASVVMLCSRSHRRRWVLLAAVAAAWSAYVAVVGGDIFPAWRQLVPALVVLGLMVAEGATALLGLRAWPRWVLAVALPSWALVLGLHVHTQRQDGENIRARIERWEWEGLPLGRLLRDGFASMRPAPVLAVDAAGALPFWSELPALDMLGLNDSWIAHHPPPDFGTGPIGHELGDGAYLLRRAPELIAFCGASGARAPCFRGGKEMVADPRFASDYRLARFRAGAFTGEFWVKVSSGPLAGQSTERSVVLPAWLLANHPPATVVAGEQGGLRVDARQGVSADVLLPAGTWRVVGEHLTASFRCGAVTATREGPGDTFWAAGPQRVNVEVRSGAREEHWLTSLTLERVDEGQTGERGFRCPGAEEVIHARAETLSWPRSERELWNAAGALVFGHAGARIDFDSLQPGGVALELSSDNNDTYEFRFLDGGEAVDQKVLRPANNGGGLALWRIESARPFTAVEVRATGDGSYSIGHLQVAATAGSPAH